MAIHPDEFALHLEILSRIGRFVTLQDLAEGSTEEGALCFVLTFDDGYRDNRTALVPILERFHVPAAIYVCGAVASGEMEALPHDQKAGFHPALLQPEDLRALAGHPLITLGSHTYSHPRLISESEEARRVELVRGREAVEQAAGIGAPHFAAPYGGRQDADWPTLLKTAAAAGFSSVASNHGGSLRGVDDRTTPFLFPRVSMGPMSADIVQGWVLRHANNLIYSD